MDVKKFDQEYFIEYGIESYDEIKVELPEYFDIDTEEMTGDPFDILDIEKLKCHTQPATIGHGRDTCIDLLHRDSSKIKDFKITNFKLENYSSIIGAVRKLFFLSKDDEVFLEPYQINLYQKGDFFKEHIDKKNKSNSFGTVVLILNNEFKNGELIYYGYNDFKHTFNYDNFYREITKKKFGWVVTYKDTMHSVTSILEGTRLSMTYDIQINYNFNLLKLKPRNEIILKKYLDLDSIKEAKKVSYRCTRLYKYEILTNTERYLYGLDKLIFDWFISNGFSYRIIKPEESMENNSIVSLHNTNILDRISEYILFSGLLKVNDKNYQTYNFKLGNGGSDYEQQCYYDLDLIQEIKEVVDYYNCFTLLFSKV